MPHTIHAIEIGEVLDEDAFDAEDLARACCVAVDWVHARIEAGVLQADPGGPGRFSSATLLRARRIAQLEAIFDADPHLAALTADLIEEVTELRRRMQALERRR